MSEILAVSSILLWLIVLFNLLITLTLVRRFKPGHTDGLKVGQQAPAFSADTADGRTVDLATYAGRKVAFVFFATNCAPCRDALPNYETLGPKAARSGVELVLVSVDTMERTQVFIDELHVRLPVLVAPRESNPFMRDYNITGTPSYCLIGDSGKVESAGYPNPDWGEWKSLADSWEAVSEMPKSSVMLAGRR